MRGEKVRIRFLKSGSVEVERPKGLDSMTQQERLEWATQALEGMSDEEIIDAMADYPDPAENGYFDSAPTASAVETVVGEILVQTKEWSLYATADGMDILADNELDGLLATERQMMKEEDIKPFLDALLKTDREVNS